MILEKNNAMYSLLQLVFIKKIYSVYFCMTYKICIYHKGNQGILSNATKLVFNNYLITTLFFSLLLIYQQCKHDSLRHL